MMRRVCIAVVPLAALIAMIVLFTTVPSMILTLLIFVLAGFFLVDVSSVDTQEFAAGLARTFHITPWTLLVPFVTGALVVFRLPSLAVLFVSALLGGVCALVLQGDVLRNCFRSLGFGE